jgi:PAS domain S-box-containing protein
VEEAVSVSVWADAAALDGIVGGDRDRPIGDAEVDELLLAPPTIEHFDAVTVTRDRPDAPALLLADDERRFVYATPAAAQLMGRSLSRLLTMRVEDLAAPDVRDAVPEMWSRFLTSGSMEGAFNLARPDGSEFKVTFSARAGVPWPGCHTSVMTPDAPAAAPDIDEALAAAGVVARYTTGI